MTDGQGEFTVMYVVPMVLTSVCVCVCVCEREREKYVFVLIIIIYQPLRKEKSRRTACF